MTKTRLAKKAARSLQKVIDAFRNGDIAEKCALATFPMPNVPASRWTMSNRWLAMIQTGEVDCRGFKQWQEVGRSVKKGSSAAYIFAPRTRRQKDESTGEESLICVGFGTIPVFSVTETEGAELDYVAPTVPDLPLLKVAQAWNIEVVAKPFVGKAYGSFSPSQSNITLHSGEKSVFFHELCHAAHHLLKGQLDPAQETVQEAIAELGAEVLRRLLGSDNDTSGNCYQYIEHYARKSGMGTLELCLQVLYETASVVALILKTAETLETCP